MARPKKGMKGYEEANRKWRETMLARCGGAKELHKKMQEIGYKGGSSGKGPGYKGGFASDRVGEDGLTGRERSIICGRIGGQKSKRGRKTKDPIDEAEKVLTEELSKNGRD